MMGVINKICPVCGETGVVERGRNICWGCENKIALVDDLIKKLENKKDDDVFVIIGATPHWNQYISTHYDGRYVEDDDLGRTAQKLFFKLAKAIIEPIPMNREGDNPIFIMGKTDRHCYINDGGYSGLLPKSAAEAFAELYQVVIQIAKSEYRLGVEHGRDLLNQLNNGEISSTEFYSDKRDR